MPSLPDLLTYSRSLIRALQEPNGAYPASPTFSAYRGYCWFRDGSFIADAMSSVGEVSSATAFFDWCSGVILRHQDKIERIVAAAEAGRPLSDDEMLPARFAMDGSLVQDGWWNFQLDGYGTWLWAAVEHSRRYNLDLGRWQEPIRLTVEYLVSSWSRPCYDWWEEHSEQVHVSTLGCIAAGLRAVTDTDIVAEDLAARARATHRAILQVLDTRGTRDGHLVKWLDSDTVDGSLSALISPLLVIDPHSPTAESTIRSMERDLCADGGVYRFRADTFFGGGRWPLLTCFLGLARLASGDRKGALACLTWAAATATPDGDLPEQVDGGLLLHPSDKQQWVDRWGPVATPLLWSHAMVLKLAAELSESHTLQNPITPPAGLRSDGRPA